MVILLALESSCDETAVSIIRGDESHAQILSSEIASQIVLHREYGGVVPELASREHSLHLRRLIEQALTTAHLNIEDIDAFAATTGPGLASSLLIGATAAKAMAASLHKPFIGINHLEGHLLSPFITLPQVPAHLSLIISGGHTLLLKVIRAGQYELLGSTLDDAAGEAFDKVGKMLGLPYPGGPEIEKTARGGSPTAYDFPRSMQHEDHFNFSFSGLKTAVLYTLQREAGKFQIEDICASFQTAVIDVLIKKSLRAAKEHHLNCLAISGGVSMNRALRDAFELACQRHNIKLLISDPAFCTDNAAMIAFAALLRHLNGENTPLDQDIQPNLALISQQIKCST